MLKKPWALTSVVLAGQSWGVEIFWSPPQRPLPVPDSQSHAVVPLVLLHWARLVPQHVNKSSGSKRKEMETGIIPTTNPQYSRTAIEFSCSTSISKAASVNLAKNVQKAKRVLFLATYEIQGRSENKREFCSSHSLTIKSVSADD